MRPRIAGSLFVSHLTERDGLKVTELEKALESIFKCFCSGNTLRQFIVNLAIPVDEYATYILLELTG